MNLLINLININMMHIINVFILKYNGHWDINHGNPRFFIVNILHQIIYLVFYFDSKKILN